jgi:hypothetical protein
MTDTDKATVKPSTVKVKLTRKSRGHKLGAVLEVSPSEAARLIREKHAVKA